ncbi:hypothetical protein AUJ14_00280 [Candidatus Micrarchaeota archaeon CG1_02_55_22]|nr:MAG: hypothetical protein AUJ14_00280 [Candidatus Micrarchaeota archaeon CG1_02_55_22]
MAKIVIAYGEHPNETLAKRRARQVAPLLEKLGHEVILRRVALPNSPHRIVQAVLRASTREAAFKVLDDFACLNPGLVPSTLQVTAGLVKSHPDAHIFNFHSWMLGRGTWNVNPTPLVHEDRSLLQRQNAVRANPVDQKRVSGNLMTHMISGSGKDREVRAAGIQYAVLKGRRQASRVAALVENTAKYTPGPIRPGAEKPVLLNRTLAALELMRDWYCDRHSVSSPPKSFQDRLATISHYTAWYSQANSHHPLSTPEFAQDLAYRIDTLVRQAETENNSRK